MSATHDSTLADRQQIVAELQRQLAECCGYKLTTFAPVAGFETAPRSFRRRQGGRCGSRSPNPLASEGRREQRKVSLPEPLPGATALSTRQYARIVHTWGREHRASP
jgi:hypothetical protein